MSHDAPFGSRVSPADHDLAARQWSDWRASRRTLLGAVALAGGALALNNSTSLLSPVRVAAQDGEPVMGGTLAMSLADDDVTTFDPIIPTDNMAIWTMLLIYDQLIRVAADGLSLEPGLAESWDVSEDGTVYTFKLRAAKFHDGTDCTAEDAAFCITRAAGEEATNWGFLFSAIDSAVATDPSTLTITLKQAWAPFEADLALFGASIYPKAAFDSQKDALWEKPIGTGPFVFDSWDKGTKITLKKFADYWDQPKPYLDQLDFYVLTDSNARMLQFQAGDLDVVTAVPFSQTQALSANPEYAMIPNGVARIDYIGMNVTKAPLDDKNLRQAINYAVDKDVIITNILFGAGSAANTYLPLMTGHDDSLPGYPFDLDKAKELVAKSSSPDGFELELLVASGDATGSQVSELVKAALSQIGGTVTVTQLEPGLRTERRNALDFQLLIGYYTTDIIDPDELTVFAVLSDGGTQAVWTGYKNEEVDALILEAQTELDQTKRLEIYSQIQQKHMDDAPFLFLYYPNGQTATQAYVKNFRVLPTGNYRLFETWIENA